MPMLRRERIVWSQHYWFHTDLKNVPGVLLIGDSIVVGHGEMTADKLAPDAMLGFYACSQLAGDPGMFRDLAVALGDYRTDLIVLNNGLHLMDAPGDMYKDGMKYMIEQLLQSSRARLCWRTSTPVTEPDKTGTLHGELNPVVVERNRIGEELCREYGMPCLDLYTPMLNHPEYRAADGVHYLKQGYDVQSDLLAGFIRGQLGIA